MCSGEGPDSPPAGGGHDEAVQVDRRAVPRVGAHARQLEAPGPRDAGGGAAREATRARGARAQGEPGVPPGEGARAREGRGARPRATGGALGRRRRTRTRARLRPCALGPRARCQHAARERPRTACLSFTTISFTLELHPQ